MQKNAEKPASEKLDQNDQVNCGLYTEKTRLGGPILQIGGVKPLPCEVRLSSKVLAAAGLGPSYEVEMTARDGEIIVKRLGGPARSIVNDLKPRRTPIMDSLMTMTRKYDARQRATMEGEPYPSGEDEGEGQAAGLSDVQIDQEEL